MKGHILVGIIAIVAILGIAVWQSGYFDRAIWANEVPGFGVIITSISAEYSDGTNEVLYKNQPNTFQKSEGLIFKTSSSGSIITSITFHMYGIPTGSGYSGCQVDLSSSVIDLKVVRQSTGVQYYNGAWIQTGQPVLTVNGESQVLLTKVITGSDLTTIDNLFGSLSGNTIWTFSVLGSLRYRGTGVQTGSWIDIALPSNSVITLYRQYI